MSGDAKVVPLKTATSPLKATEQVQLARLPAPVHALQEKGKRLLQPLLHALFDQADDALFELADKAPNNQEQNLYFESMRELRLRRREMESRFSAAIDRAFAALAKDAPDNQVVDSYGEISLDDLTLVKNEELEELVAVDTMVTRANEHYAESIQHLALRIDSLVPLKVYQRNSPLGPHVLCTAFSEAATGLDVDIKARLVIYKLFEKSVIQALGPFYRATNQLLIEKNVLPSLHTGAQRGGRTPIPTSAPTAAKADAEGVEDAVLQSLRELLGADVGAASAGSRSNPSCTPALPSRELVSLLSDIQHKSSGGAREPLNVGRLVNELLSREPAGKRVDQVDHDVINLVNMLFEFILDDHNLATPMKALLGRLQIPIIKVAIADKSFFGKGGHPARRLLNEMARAALEWQPDATGTDRSKDLLFNKLDAIVKRLISEFDSDVGIFDELLAELMSFMEKDRRRAAILERRTVDAEDGKAKAEHARAQVDQALVALVEGQALPPVVMQLLQQAWANVLFLISLKQGDKSDDWQAAIQVGKDLVWSVTVDINTENRRQLLKLVPDLLKRLRKGLEEVSFNPFEMTQLFKSLEKIHLSKLKAPVVAQSQERALSTAPPKPDAVVAGDNVSAKPSSGLALESIEAQEASASATSSANASPDNVSANMASSNNASSDKAPEPADASASAKEDGLPESDPHIRQVDKLTQGAWFELSETENHPFRCRLAAIIKPVGKYIFVNRSGLKVAEKNRQGLAYALKAGSLRILDDGMLFDRALEAVIGNLRHSRKQGG